MKLNPDKPFIPLVGFLNLNCGYGPKTRFREKFPELEDIVKTFDIFGVSEINVGKRQEVDDVVEKFDNVSDYICLSFFRKDAFNKIGGQKGILVYHKEELKVKMVKQPLEMENWDTGCVKLKSYTARILIFAHVRRKQGAKYASFVYNCMEHYGIGEKSPGHILADLNIDLNRKRDEKAFKDMQKSERLFRIENQTPTRKGAILDHAFSFREKDVQKVQVIVDSEPRITKSGRILSDHKVIKLEAKEKYTVDEATLSGFLSKQCLIEEAISSHSQKI